MSTSALSHAAICAITLPSIGETQSNVAPLTAATYAPLMKARPSGWSRSAASATDDAVGIAVALMISLTVETV
jgi:hypothetical protein